MHGEIKHGCFAMKLLYGRKWQKIQSVLDGFSSNIVATTKNNELHLSEYNGGISRI
jgi:hypothetical protein